LCKFTEDNGYQVVAILHMTITTFIGVVYPICVTKLDDSLLGGEVQLYPSVEKLGLISNSILCGLLGGVFFNLIYTVVCM
jgi:hypothetical protein